jgi:hypothetical protein
MNIFPWLSALACAVLIAFQDPGQHPATREASGLLDPGDTVSASTPLIPVGTVHSRPAAGQEPKISIERQAFQFESLEPGQQAMTEFKFKNEGPGPLKFLQIRAMCSCIAGGITVDGKPYVLGQPILPGSTGIIRVGIQALWNAGPKHTRLDVLTNDPQFGPTSDAPFGHMPLRIDANIVKIVEFDGPDGRELPDNRLNLGSFASDKPLKTTLLCRSVVGRAFTVAGIVPQDPSVQMEVSPVGGEPGRAVESWKIDITIPPGMPFGQFTKRFIVSTVPEMKGLQFYVDGTVRGLIECDPPASSGLRLGLVTPGPNPLGKIVLKSAGEQKLAIRNVRFCEFTDYKAVDGKYQIAPGKKERPLDPKLSRYMKADATSSEDGRTATIQISIRSGMPRGAVNAMLVFETGIPGGPEQFVMPIVSVVR